jgi:site-specific recombinase XerD
MIQLKAIYNLNNKLRKDGTAQIYIRAYLNNKRKCFATGILIKPSQWSNRLEKVIDHPSANEYNLETSRQLTALETYVYDWVRQHGSITLAQLNNYFKYEGSESFTNFWKYELEHDTILQKETKKKHKTALNYFVKFQKEVKFSELTYQFIVDFDRFLYKHKLHPNTVHTHHKQVKKYINLAIRQEIFKATKNPYLKFKAKKVETERMVLSAQEVNKLEALTFSGEEFYLELIRDMFLFSCYTGLRFSDTSALSYENINHDKEGMVLNIVAQKTNKQFLLPLYKLYERKPEAIVQKYRDEVLHERGLIFHKYTNQYFNRALKKVAAKAEISKAITSHVARHTFATHLAAKVPIHILKSILQHSNIETTMIYLHLSSKLVNDALDGVEW